MNPNLSTSYVATRIERSRLAAQAERGWEAEQAAAPSHLPSAKAVVRRSLGTLLVVTGERLQGTPRRRQAPAS